MEKILLAVNSQDMNFNTVKFACYLAKLTNSTLDAIFLEDVVLEYVTHENEEQSMLTGLKEYQDKMDIRNRNIEIFKSIADEEGVQALAHFDIGLPLEDLISASKFADVLVVDALTSFEKGYDSMPSKFVKDILHDAGCPVIIPPENSSDVDNIIFCYDGSKSSIFAIKQFTYLFPALAEKKAEVVYINKETEPVTDEDFEVTQWLKYHYSNIEFIALDKALTESFFEYLMEKKNDFVVMGAYGKGLLSQFFEYDPDEQEVRLNKLPIFIAHY
ncbi:MAG TPA: universal stress protein [Puia sp.]|nr:universal stress protein [Puia sp.]